MTCAEAKRIFDQTMPARRRWNPMFVARSGENTTIASLSSPPFLVTPKDRTSTPARTKQAVILADQRISAAEAYEWRLVEEVADPGKAFDAAMALAAKVAAQPPLSVAMTKLTVNRLAHALDDLAKEVPAYHAGQTAILRRIAGKEGAIR